jgi:hypothetical protein
MEPGKIKIGDEVFFVVLDSILPEDPIAMIVRIKVEEILYQGTTHERVRGMTFDSDVGYTRPWNELSAACWPDRITALSQARMHLHAEKAKLEKMARALGFRLL